MTLEKEIRDLLAPLEMPVAQHVYTGAAERYIVFETMFGHRSISDVGIFLRFLAS